MSNAWQPSGSPAPWLYVPLPPILSIIKLRARKYIFALLFEALGASKPAQAARAAAPPHTFSGTLTALHTHARGSSASFCGTNREEKGRKGRGFRKR